MEKSIYSREYETFQKLLREIREEKGLTQIDIANRLGETQSFVSKVERGERRLDVIELRTFCSALEISLPALIKRLESALS